MPSAASRADPAAALRAGFLSARDARQALLHRHLAGDWGALCSDDVAANEAALTHGSRILSSYEIALGVTVWVITDAETDRDEAGNALTPPQRLCTTILRPEDY